MSGHIKLGLPGALRDYNLEPRGADGLAWDSGPAFPFAAKVNSTNEYDELDAWNELTLADYQQGVGRVDPEAGGALYADVETRVPNQLILSPLIRQVDKRIVNNTTSDCRYMPENMTGEVTVGAGGHERVAMRFTTPASGSPSAFLAWFYASIPNTVEVKFEIWSHSVANLPDALVSTSHAYTPAEDTPGWYWHGRSISFALSNSTQYWLVVYPTNPLHSFKVGNGTTGYDTSVRRFTTGTGWAATSSTYLMFGTSIHYMGASTTGSGFFRLGNKLYHYTNLDVFEYDTVNDQWDFVDDIDNLLSTTSAVVWSGKVYFTDPILGMTTMDTTEVMSYEGGYGFLAAKYGPYLYRANFNTIQYSADGSTWSSFFTVGGDESYITGMAGMGDSLYVATTEALYRFAPGDVVEGVTTWGSLDESNGSSMINYQGSIYVVVNGRVVNFTQDGRVMDIWIGSDDDVVRGRIGQVRYLCRMNNWLIALVSHSLLGGKPSVWALQDGSWHHLATLPAATPLTDYNYYGEHSVYYDRATRSLWVSGVGGVTYRLYTPDFALNPYNDGSAYYMPRGWIEQDRFYGGQYLLNKDWDSVRIVGENLSANVNVKIYWQDEGSATWELLGTATSEQEIRWAAPYTTRPNGKWIRLGLLLQTNDGDETPRIRAVVVKFLPKSVTKIQDSLFLMIKGSIQGPDGSRDAYTAAQQWTHIKSLINSVGPVIYMNPDGEYYEVQISDWSQLATTYAWENSASIIKEKRVRLVVRQINDEQYTPPA